MSCLAKRTGGVVLKGLRTFNTNKELLMESPGCARLASCNIKPVL
jgi:hypothetical protein